MSTAPLPFCGWVQPANKAHAALERHLPEGVAWLAWRTPGKVAFLLFRALCRSFDDAWVALCRLSAELDPRSTVDMITDWETAVGLPDPCLPNAVTLEERRYWVMWRLAKRRWSTAQDWFDLAAIFGIELRLTPGWYIQEPSLYEIQYPSLYLMPKLGRFRLYLDITDGCGGNGYPYSYPMAYGFASRCTDFQCIIERIRPSNVAIVWNDTPAVHAHKSITKDGVIVVPAAA